MTRSQSLTLLSELAAAFPRQSLQPNTVALYAAHLVQFDFNRGLDVVRSYIVSQKWFPSLSELVAELDEAPTPVEAWALVMVQLRQHGHTSAPILPPLVQKVVGDFGGWGRLCKMENTVAERSRFIELYDRKFRAQLGESYALTGKTLPQLALTEGGAS